jgi:hypothetical protein
MSRKTRSRSVNFETAVNEAVRECQSIGYRPTYFRQMLADLGAIGAAQILINTAKPSDRFTRLWELQRLDLTVEAIVLRPGFEELFTRAERDIAIRRLHDYGCV